MRTLLCVILTVTACSKSADEKIKAVKNAPENERAHKYCELAKSADDAAVNSFLFERLNELANADVAPDATSEDVECLPKALASAKNGPAIGAQLTILHFKRSAVASLTPLYDAIPAAKKKDYVLFAFNDLGKGEHWTKSADVAAPAMLAELDKLGGSEDPDFFKALVGAYAMAPDKTAPAIKERYAKVATDPRTSAGWTAQLKEIAKYSDVETWKRYAPFMSVAVAELAAHNVTLEPYEAEAVLKVCGSGGAECSAASVLNDASKAVLRERVNFNANYDWAAPAKEFLVNLGGPGTDPMTLAFDEAETTLRNRDQLDRTNGKPREDTSKLHPIQIDDDRLGVFGGTVDKIAAMGPSAVPKLVELFKTSADPLRHRAAAQALAKLDPALLAKETIALLEAYDARFRPDLSSGDANVSAGLRALAAVQGDAATNTILRALSSPDPAISAFATTTIKKRLERDAAIAALFSYMAAKEKYAQAEIDIYVGLVTSYGGEATGALVKNLEAHLAAAGTPEKVFWAVKVVAMTALEKVGTRSAADVIKKYASDSGGFQRFSIDKSGKPTTPREVPFKELTDAALKAVSSRA